MRRFALILAMMAGPASADGFEAMTGAQINAALSDRSLTYAGTTQKFYASGRTLYDAGRPSWGYWAVRGDQYCSQWPPNDTWDCYDMASDGEIIRFIGPAGHVTDGVYSK
ncbi:hypothetical protein [Algirhabdus cladophorae]|uniref:hypothetical protein n=1 Tax=Algirhabdus cladophorae TaxID=3377108 RepID=UPI003B846B86